MRFAWSCLVVVVAAAGVAGCASAGHRASVIGVEHGPAKGETSSPTTTEQPGHAASLSTLLELSATTVTSGGTIRGQITVDNGTGRPIPANGCALFAVELNSNTYHPEPNWTACLDPISIPTGVSHYPITINASYDGCYPNGPVGTIPACSASGLPPGLYRATIYQGTQVVPPPSPIAVTVTP